MDGIDALMKETPQGSPTPSAMREHGKKTAVYLPGK